MNTSAAHLELHTCIGLSSNCQEFVTDSSRLTYCSPLPLDATNFVNITIQNRAGLLCIWWAQSRQQLCCMHLTNDSSLTHTAEHPFTHSERNSCRNGTVSKSRFWSVFSVWCSRGTCLCFVSARPTKNQHSVVFSGVFCLENSRCTAVSVSVFTKHRPSSSLCGSLFLN